MSPLVSVIIPCYNVEKYLKQCLDSVVNQTLKDIEIICINDGSTDKSLQILTEYAEKDKRIKVISKHNSGYGASMNIGLDNATGKYIGIVEPDDYIELNMYEVLYNIAIKTDVDFVKSDFYQFSEELVQHKILLDYSNNHYERIIRTENEKTIFNIRMNTWTGIYKNEFIKCNHIRYNETPGARYQDQGFWFQTMIYAKLIYIVNQPFYHYRFFQTNSTNNPNGIDWIKTEYQYILDILNKNSKLKIKFLGMYTKFDFNNILFNYKKLDNKTKRKKLYEIRDYFIKKQKNNDIDLSEINVKNFNLLINNPKKFYRKLTNTPSVLQRIFSIKNKNYHKIIRIFGIKIKIKSKKLEEQLRIKRIEQKLDKLSNKIDSLNNVLEKIRRGIND